MNPQVMQMDPRQMQQHLQMQQQQQQQAPGSLQQQQNVVGGTVDGASGQPAHKPRKGRQSKNAVNKLAVSF